MANDQSETPVPSTPESGTKIEAPAAAVEAGTAVEGAVAATSNPTEYALPNDAQKAAIESELFGDEHLESPVTPDGGEPGKKYEPENIVFGHA
ncbi:hypothetical protein [Kitasatospora sp. NPDC005856]|uniref:hypothetical protein n=1 Tax=Kitasatospora sp. NPDC005856 TaxID=3154566 RepID=UPI0033E2001B